MKPSLTARTITMLTICALATLGTAHAQAPAGQQAATGQAVVGTPVIADPAATATAALAKTLGVSVVVAQQIQSIEDDKETWTPAQRKLSSDYIYLARMARGVAAAPGVQTLQVVAQPEADGRYKTIVFGTMSRALSSAIAGLGGTVVDSAGGDSLIALLPLASIETLAGRPDVRSMRPYVAPHNNRMRELKHAENRNARALVPYRRYSQFAELAAALAKQPPTDSIAQASSHGITIRSTAATYDEGYFTHDVPTAVSKFGVTGSGIRVGVMSDDDEYMANAQTTGDLPPTDTSGTQAGASVTIAVDDTQSPPVSQDGPTTGQTGEGTAMMCIVHHMAPNAKIFYASAAISEAQFAKNILLLRFKYHCDVICDDVGWGDEAVFCDGPIAQAVNDVVADGAMYFSSAGNASHVSNYSNIWYGGSTGFANGEAPTTYESDFVNGGTVTKVGSTTVSGTVHAFASGVAYDTLKYPAGSDYSPAQKNVVVLNWSDPDTGSNNDYDLFSVNGNSTYSASTGAQTGTQQPLEAVYALANHKLVILKHTSAGVRALHLYSGGAEYSNVAAMTYSTSGTTFGHDATANGFGVAATPAIYYTPFNANGPYQQSPYQSGPNANSIFSSSTVSDSFSSDGPREVFYNVTGGPYLSYAVQPSGYTMPNSQPVFTPINTTTPGYTFASGGGIARIQPAVTAADGVSTGEATSLNPTTLDSNFNPFFGTSAAAPHAASIAALIKSYSGSSAGLTINGSQISVSEMHTLLQNTAIDIESPGVDNTTGYGVIMPVPALQYLVNFLPVGSITAATQSATGATITWNTDLPAGSLVNYGTTSSLGNSASNPGDQVLSHSVNLTGLQSGTLYYYQVVSATPTASASYTDPASALHTFATSGAATQASLAVTGYSISSAGGVITAVITVSNRGTGTASGVQVTTATLGGTSTTAALPASVGTIAAGATATVSLTFASPASGTTSVLKVAGSDSAGDSFSVSTRISIP